MDIIEKNIQKLLTTTNPGVACDAINTLHKKVTESTREQVLQALMQYAENGVAAHIQSHAVATLVELVQGNEAEHADFFIACMESGDNAKLYWGILGYCKVKEKDSYEYLMNLLFSSEITVEFKALIVKNIAKLSNNPFDVNKPYECREWKDEDIEYGAIRVWAENGYPDGNGYEEPKRHRCLDAPESAVEKQYARLDKKLLKKRAKKQDLAHPSNWLIQATQADLDNILQKWALPKGYFDFLEKASPLDADFKIKGYGAVMVYGAHDFVKGQYGYAINPNTNEQISGWNPNYIVIAQRYGDPFCIDIALENSPVYFAFHGMGKWEFTEEFESFFEFLKRLG